MNFYRENELLIGFHHFILGFLGASGIIPPPQQVMIQVMRNQRTEKILMTMNNSMRLILKMLAKRRRMIATIPFLVNVLWLR
jgi:hypothetical protein